MRLYRVFLSAVFLLSIPTIAAARSPLLYDQIQRLPAHSGGTVRIELTIHNLAVDIVPGHEMSVRTQIWASGDKAGDRQKIIRRYVPKVVAKGNDVEIRAPELHEHHWTFWSKQGDRVRARVTVSMPKGMPLDCRLGVGDFRFDNPGVVASIEARLGTGSAFVRARPHRLGISDGTGNIDFGGKADELRLHSGTGDIVIEGGSARSASLDVGAGNIRAHWTSFPGGASLHARTGAGNLVMVFPAATALSGQVSVGVGSVNTDFPAIVRSDGHDYALKGGAGALHVELSSGLGDVSLRRAGGEA